MTECVSIITPMFNAETTIVDTIDSVLKQTYTNWELLIINDQSTDKSVDRQLTGEFIVKNTQHEDYATWRDLARNRVSMRGIDRPLAYCRVGKQTLTANKLESAVWTWWIYREHEKLGIIKDAFYFCTYAVQGLWKRY